MDLSVIIPAFNEETRITSTVSRVVAYLDARESGYEVIIVDDGSRDGTNILLRSLALRIPRVCIFTLGDNRGKGAALAVGVGGSCGDQILISDADLSTPIEEIEKLERAITAGADVAIASRARQGAQVEISQPWYRVAMGRTFNLAVRALLLPGLYDTQCGFKLFRGSVGRRLFAACSTDGFAYDVEVLYRARLQGLVVEEVPVRWINSGQSRVLPIRHSAEMFGDLLRLRLGSMARLPVRDAPADSATIRAPRSSGRAGYLTRTARSRAAPACRVGDGAAALRRNGDGPTF
jgi:dolichyl-phosphate beta-glucosyltransferase